MANRAMNAKLQRARQQAREAAQLEFTLHSANSEARTARNGGGVGRCCSHAHSQHIATSAPRPNIWRRQTTRLHPHSRRVRHGLTAHSFEPQRGYAWLQRHL